MSLKDMIVCIRNNDIDCLKVIINDDDTYLTEKICTKLLVECLEHNRIAIANYIIRMDFDLDAAIFEDYIERNKPFTEKQVLNLNKILGKFLICCLVES
jgi:hypothetical protein